MFLFFQKAFKDALKEPDFIMSDFAKLDRPPQLHLAFQAVHTFKQKNGRLPKPWNEVCKNISLLKFFIKLFSIISSLKKKLIISLFKLI